MSLDGVEVRMQCQDSGVPFDPMQPAFNPDAPLEERRAGGTGLFMVISMMDEAYYERPASEPVS